MTVTYVKDPLTWSKYRDFHDTINNGRLSVTSPQNVYVHSFYNFKRGQQNN